MTQTNAVMVTSGAPITTVVAITYTYDNANRLTNAGGITCTWDSNDAGARLRQIVVARLACSHCPSQALVFANARIASRSANPTGALPVL